MRRDTLDEARDVRAFLEGMAGEVPPGVGSPRPAVRRARRRLAGTALAGLLLISLAGWTGVAVVRSAVSPAEHVPGSSARMFTVDDLHLLVLADSPERGGEPFVDQDSGSFWSPYDVASTTRVPLDELQAAGLTDAYGTAWATADFVDPGGKVGMSLVSIAMLFPDSEGAARAYAAFHRSPSRWSRADLFPADGLGPDAYGVRGYFEGLDATGVVWRVDNVLLFVGSQGAFPLVRMWELANEMNAQAFRA